MNRLYYPIAALFLFFSCSAIYFSTPQENCFTRVFDEGRYLSNTQYLMDHGLQSYPGLYAQQIQKKQDWIMPTPLRVGYFLLAYMWLKVFGPSLRHLANLSLLCYLLYLLVVLCFSAKHFGRDISRLLLLLLIPSPLAMGLARRVMTDSVGNLFICLSLWLFLDFLSERKLWKFILFEACFIYAILIREQALLLIFFFGLFFLIYKYGYKVNISLRYLIAMLLVILILAGSAWLVSAQSLTNVVMIVKIGRLVQAVNRYSLDFCRGPWFRYIIDYMLISPVVTILALSFLVYSLINRSVFKDYKVAYFVLALAVYYALLSLDCNKNVRYALSLDMPMRLLAVLTLGKIFQGEKSGSNRFFFCVVFLCLLDFFAFSDLYLTAHIYDPVSRNLLFARGFIPY